MIIRKKTLEPLPPQKFVRPPCYNYLILHMTEYRLGVAGTTLTLKSTPRFFRIAHTALWATNHWTRADGWIPNKARNKYCFAYTVHGSRKGGDQLLLTSRYYKHWPGRDFPIVTCSSPVTVLECFALVPETRHFVWTTDVNKYIVLLELRQAVMMTYRPSATRNERTTVW